MKRLFPFILFAISLFTVKAQQTVSIGTTSTNNKAVLLLASSGGNQGLIIPIVSNKSAITSPGTSEKAMIVFDDSDKKLYCFNGTAWVEISTGAGGGGTYTMALNGSNNSLELKNGAAVVSTIPLGNDIKNNAGTLTVDGLKDKSIPALPGTTQALVYNGTAWVFQALAAGTGDITDVTTNAGSGLSGGVTSGNAILSLTNTGVIANIYGNATTIPQITVDAQGRITNATTTAIADASATNEIQNLALAGATGSATPGEVFNVNISSGTGVTLTEGTNVDITRSGTNLTIGASLTGAITTGSAAGGDLAGTYPNPTIANSGTAGTDIITAINNGATTGTIPSARIGNLDASKITTGTLAVARGGTGVATAPTNGQLLIGNAGNYSVASLTAGTGITVTPGAGSLSVATSGNFAALDLTTTGKILSGDITTTNLASVNGVSYTWPNALVAGTTYLTNNGSGGLSWTPLSTGFSTANYIPRGDGAGLISSSIYDDGSYTAIGRTSPVGSSRFDIETNAASGSYGGMYITTQSGGKPFYGYFNSSNTAYTEMDGADQNKWKVFNQTGHHLAITPSGDISLGTTQADFQIWQPVNASITSALKTVTIAQVTDYADNSPGILEISGASGAIDDEIGIINFTNQSSNTNNYNFARISAHKDNSGNDTYASLRFYTRQGATMTECMRINSSARVGIGRNAVTNIFEVEGGASKTVAGSWVANSDRRIKTDFQEINGIELVKKLHPVKFKYTEQWKKLHPSIQDKFYYNFIAQEFQQVFPEAVQGSGEFIEGDTKEVLQIDTYNAEIATIKAVQELIQRVEQLEKENQQLKAEKQQMENEVKAELSEIKRLLEAQTKNTSTEVKMIGSQQ